MTTKFKLYVEGGGDRNHQLRQLCREGFTKFLKTAGLCGNMPRVVACGGRKAAFDDFCIAIKNGEKAILLVDSECTLLSESSWEHLGARTGDKWQRPKGTTDEQCYLMVQCMESWFLADIETLEKYYGHGFKRDRLPASNPEEIDKNDIYNALKRATQNCDKNDYKKGRDSFVILGGLNPDKVRTRCPHVDKFLKGINGLAASI